MNSTLFLQGLKRFGYGVAVCVSAVYTMHAIEATHHWVKGKFFTKPAQPVVAA